MNEIGRLMGGERRLGGGPADADDTSWLMFPKDGEVGQHTVDYGLVKTHYLVKNLKIILDLCVPIIVSSQKKYSV